MSRGDADDRAAETRRAVDSVWRIESGRLIAGLARSTGDIGLAEELAQDAHLWYKEKKFRPSNGEKLVGYAPPMPIYN